ncbi:MAG: hypothetical protein BZ136_08390 [Methanosphaera sp. rholeuAM74]|nr:MAG: hypothetical protein BZ136_08390 [Methanosphaera sp. rholeuAM74]
MEDKKKAIMNGELTEQDVAETNAKLDSEKLDGVSGGIALCAEDKAPNIQPNEIFRHKMENNLNSIPARAQDKSGFILEQKEN